MARERLKPGGVMSAWFHTYHMGDAELRAGIKTFLEVFPHATLWLANESDLVLVGTLEPAEIDEGFAGANGIAPGRRRPRGGSGSTTPPTCWPALRMDRGRSDGLRRGARLHTDDNMLMEFQAGRRVVEATHGVHLTNILERLRPTWFAGI